MAREISIQNGLGIAEAARSLGKEVFSRPYRWGGKTKAGFDCSGFVSHVFSCLYPHQADHFLLNVAGFADSDLFETVQAPYPGDLIIFPKYQGDVNHMGIVISSTHWIGAQSRGVREVSLANPYWSRRPHSFRRFKESSPVAIKISFSKIGNHWNA